MPQMSPMNWLLLFFLFTCIFYLTMLKINFSAKFYLKPSVSTQEAGNLNFSLTI